MLKIMFIKKYSKKLADVKTTYICAFRISHLTAVQFVINGVGSLNIEYAMTKYCTKSLELLEENANSGILKNKLYGK